MTDTKNPITVEQSFIAPIEKLWEAITDKHQMKEWYFDIPEFKSEVGSEFSFPGKGSAGNEYKHLCKVIEVIPMKKIVHSWTYENYEGNSIVTFELKENSHGSELKLSHEGIDTFPKSNPDFDSKNFVMGWTALISKNLKSFIEKNNFRIKKV